MADLYQMNNHKMIHHLDRVNDWQQGKRIAPLHIDVGLSKGCNIKCQYCYGVTQDNFFRKGMDLHFHPDALLRYMRDAGEIGVRSMALIGEAEPLLNPGVYDAIVTGKKAGVDISLGTNGILFDTGKPGEAALEHLTWIRFNISAATDDAYRRIHASKDFAIACDKIRFCVATKRRLDLDVTIGLQMVLMPQNLDQAVPLAKLGRELGVDYLVIKQCGDTVKNDLGIYERLHEYRDFTDTLKLAEAESAPGYNVIVKWQKIAKEGKRCYDQCLGSPFLIYSSGDGKVYPCGMFFSYRSEEFVMGNLLEQSFKDIVFSDRYWEVIERVKQSVDVHHECYANCRTNEINQFVWDLKHPPAHVNFV